MERIIRKDDASFTLSAEMPVEWGSTSSVEVNISSIPSGTALVTGSAATLYTSTILDAAIARGRNTGTLDSGASNLSSGQLIKIGTALEGWEECEVETYNSSTKVFTLKSRLNRAHAAGAAVIGRDMTVAIDVSGSTWEGVEDVTVEWDCTDLDSLPLIETWQVLERKHDVSGLEGEFKRRYPSEYNMVPVGDFGQYEDDAVGLARSTFMTGGRDVRKLIGHEFDYKEFLKRQIAVLCDPTEQNLLYLQQWKTHLDGQSWWIDEDEDLAVDDGEVLAAVTIPIRRNL
jgi:hypothetical protein